MNKNSLCSFWSVRLEEATAPARGLLVLGEHRRGRVAIGLLNVAVATKKGDEEGALTPVAWGSPEGPLSLRGETESGLCVKLQPQRGRAATEPAALVVTAKNTGRESLTFSLRLSLRLEGKGVPRWLIPGIFYKENRPAKCTRKYPRFDPITLNEEDFVSPAWSFRADRTTCPAVMAGRGEFTALLGCEPLLPGGAMPGLSLSYGAESDQAQIALDFPYREEPVTISSCHPDGHKADRAWLTLAPGQAMTFEAHIAAGPNDPYFFSAYLRYRYKKSAARNPLHAWMKEEEACALTAEGLMRWHLNSETGVLYETCAFDKYFARFGGYVDRQHMHVAWVSGAVCAYALLRYGLARPTVPLGHEAAKAGRAVLDKICSGLSPLGTFWGEWRDDKGWCTGWNPQPNWLQARTLAEATLFVGRALRLICTAEGGCATSKHKESETAGGVPQNWFGAWKSNLDAARQLQNADGNFGSYYNIETGNVDEWEGHGGILWIAALAEAAGSVGEVVGLDQKERSACRDAAERGGEFYRAFVDDAYLYGAPEDVHLTPTSEDAYNALLAYFALLELTGDEKRWLDPARKSAEWMMTFRWLYNVSFSPRTLLGAYDFRTRGGDIASPCNQHVHDYGLVCHPELVRLAERLGDDYLLQRAQDHRLCWLQMIAREDGDFGARRGMVPEQHYNTDWWQPKGHVLAVAHSWCAGMILYANQWELDHRARKG